MNFPYPIREEQARMAKDIEESLKSGLHVVIEAPTGFGKTITTLYSVHRFASKRGFRIIYLVRTNSQEQKVMEEAHKLGIRAVSIMGRTHLCPLVRENPEYAHANPEELALLCRKLREEVRKGNKDACIYYSNFLNDPSAIHDYIMEAHTAEEIYSRAVEVGVCPYMSLRDSLKSAELVAVPYIYYLMPILRNDLLQRMNTTLSETILVVDEAHNFPNFAREMYSFELSEWTIQRAEKECLEHGNPSVMGTPCADVMEFLKESIYAMKTYAKDEEGLIPEYAFEEKVSSYIGISINDFTRLALSLLKIGMMVRDSKLAKRKLPRSYIYHIGTFLMEYKNTYSSEYIRIIKMDSNPKVEIYCMDPSLINDALLNVYSSVHISGTLSINEYIRILELPPTTFKMRYSSPFPDSNLRVFYVSDVTTKYDEVKENIDKIAYYIDHISALGRNTAVFFTSYSLLNSVSEKLKTEVLVERQGMQQMDIATLINKFRSEGGVLLSVFGGRIAEGIDFPGKQLEIVIIAGIPYPKPTARVKMLMHYYDAKFGDGWNFVFRMPAIIKMKQAIGRLIRTERDKGVAVILDRRITKFSEEIAAIKSEDVVKDIEKFFDESEEKGEEGRHRDM